MGQQVSTTSFARVGTDEPHKTRRSAILAKHPEIKQLYGPDIRLLPMIVGIVATQISLAVYSTQLEGWKWFLLCWGLGGTLTHWLSLGNHELAHNLCFKKTVYNEMLGMFANCAQGLPSCAMFKRYHLEHHYHQGVDIIDVDVPTDWEGMFFDSTLKKVLWVILQPAFYALRPLLVNPKPIQTMEVVNAVTTIGFDVAFCSLLWSQGTHVQHCSYAPRNGNTPCCRTLYFGTLHIHRRTGNLFLLWTTQSCYLQCRIPQ